MLLPGVDCGDDTQNPQAPQHAAGAVCQWHVAQLRGPVEAAGGEGVSMLVWIIISRFHCSFRPHSVAPAERQPRACRRAAPAAYRQGHARRAAALAGRRPYAGAAGDRRRPSTRHHAASAPPTSCPLPARLRASAVLFGCCAAATVSAAARDGSSSRTAARPPAPAAAAGGAGAVAGALPTTSWQWNRTARASPAIGSKAPEPRR